MCESKHSHFSIQTMMRQEIDLAVEWAAAEGWNPGLHDAECFYAADPEGFLVGKVGCESVVCISVVTYGTGFGFLGFYIVKPEFRGKGYGLSLWNAGMKRLQGRTVGLDGVVAQQENYRKSGFALAYRNVRYQGFGGNKLMPDGDIVELKTIPFNELTAYDQPFFPDDRHAFLKCWIQQKEGSALGVMDNRKLAGYGVIRRCRTGYKIGPLFADTPLYADKLFSALKATVPEEEPVFLDIPEVNPAAVELVKRHNMSVVVETARMYTGIIPDLPVQKIFGITTFELG